MCCIKICFFGSGAGRSRAFMCGAGADIFFLEPEPKKKYLEPKQRKNSAAPQHWSAIIVLGSVGPFHIMLAS